MKNEALFQPLKYNPDADSLPTSRFDFWTNLVASAGMSPLTAHLPDGKPFEGVILANLLDDAKLAIPDPDTIPKAFWSEEGNKYMYVSELQKAVRFGDPLAAARAAFVMLDHGQGSYMARRLAVIASEDVGLGDPYGALVAITMSKTKKLYGRKTLLLKIIQRLCQASKSRLVCDFSVIPFMSQALKKQVYADKALTPEERIAVFNDRDQSVARRLVISVPLCGSSMSGASFDPLPKKDSKRLYDYWQGAGIPPLYKQLAVMAEGGFGMSWPLAYEASLGGLSVGLDPWTGMDSVKIGVLYAATFDKHTSIGKMAFHYVKKSKADWFSMLPHPDDEEKRMNSFSRVIFYTEGSFLSPFLHGDNMTNLYWSILHEKWKTEGWSSPETAMKAYKEISADLMPLHKARSKVMGAPVNA